MAWDHWVLQMAEASLKSSKKKRKAHSLLVTPNDGSVPDVTKQIELNLLDDDVGYWVVAIKLCSVTSNKTLL